MLVFDREYEYRQYIRNNGMKVDSIYGYREDNGDWKFIGVQVVGDDSRYDMLNSMGTYIVPANTAIEVATRENNTDRGNEEDWDVEYVNCEGNLVINVTGCNSKYRTNLCIEDMATVKFGVNGMLEYCIIEMRREMIESMGKYRE